MDCRRIDERIDAWLDGELGERERREVARHLDECARCAAEYGALVVAVERLETLAEPAAPEDFVTTVMARLPERGQAASPARIAWALGLSGALGTAASVVAGLWLLTLLAASWGGLAAVAAALPALAMSVAHGALLLGEALAAPLAWGLAMNVALLGAIALACRWRSRLASSGLFVAA